MAIALDTLYRDVLDLGDRRISWTDFCLPLIDNSYGLEINLRDAQLEGEEIEPQFLPKIELLSKVVAAFKFFNPIILRNWFYGRSRAYVTGQLSDRIAKSH